MSQREQDNPNNSFYEAWAESMDNEYDAQPLRTEPCTIHRVPDSIRIVGEGAYEPKMVSIGPYHRSNPKLKAMEDRKWHSLQCVLGRQYLSNYLVEMERLEVQVRGFYSENEEIKRIGSREFVEMMLLDGCFILELLLEAESENAAGNANDPIYSTNWILPIIRLDMLLLENQLPFLVLRHLFQFVNGSNNSSLVGLAVQFFKHVMPLKREVAPVDSFHHLLDLFHWHLLPETSPHSLIPVESPPSIPTATELIYTVKFKSLRDASSILDMKFSMGDLEIPYLCINNSTNSIFRNLIAWEQCYPARGNDLTSYVIFMDCLIDTPNDVVLLKEKGIIEHWLGNDEEVALLFNKMCMGITTNFEGRFLYDLSVKVEQLQKCRRHIWRAELIRNFLREPLTVFNLEIAALTIVLTLVQTTLAILSFKRPS